MVSNRHVQQRRYGTLARSSAWSARAGSRNRSCVTSSRCARRERAASICALWFSLFCSRGVFSYVLFGNGFFIFVFCFIFVRVLLSTKCWYHASARSRRRSCAPAARRFASGRRRPDSGGYHMVDPPRPHPQS